MLNCIKRIILIPTSHNPHDLATKTLGATNGGLFVSRCMTRNDLVFDSEVPALLN